ncbi:hypothetical protein DM52_1669 [Burkholderia mallei]|nr:hypothetical protein DM52_1669 [Burkholderia mallei]
MRRPRRAPMRTASAAPPARTIPPRAVSLDASEENRRGAQRPARRIHRT